MFKLVMVNAVKFLFALQSFPDVPRDERLRWKRYLPEGTKFEREYAYETRWTSWRGLEWYEV
jgi:hypothetical protein